jgi:hypothetical protein
MPSPLIVEDGTIIAGANSYITLANADAYHDARGNSTWIDAEEKEREEALIKATDYLIQKYRNCWKGIRVDEDQTLDWPRAGVQTEDFFEPDTGPRPALFPGLAFIVDEDEIPTEVQNATAEAAMRSLAGDLLPDVEGTRSIKRLAAGPASIEYFQTGQGPDEKIFPVIERMLEPYLDPTRGQRRVFRA